MGDSPFKPHFFEREDESPDGLFYGQPRLVAHIDDFAIEAVGRLYTEILPQHGAILDLMSSYLSHIPDSLSPARLCGVGMNEEELRRNRQLTDFVVRDLNVEPVLPFDDAEFDAVVVAVSVQYMIKPLEVFREVARVLRPGGPFVLTYSNRMFPTKAVRIWKALDDRERAGLITAYFKHAGGFTEAASHDRTIQSGGYNDPLFAVWAHRLPEDARRDG